MSDAVAMTVEEALRYADCWTKYPVNVAYDGWGVVCAALAAEVRRLREDKAESIALVESMLSKEDDKNPMAASFDSVVHVVLQILRGE